MLEKHNSFFLKTLSQPDSYSFSEQSEVNFAQVIESRNKSLCR